MVGWLAGGEDSLKAAGRAVAFAQGHRLETGDTMLAAQGILYAIDHVTLLAPVLRPGKIVCLGFNYRDHAAESALAVPEYPVLFHKVSGSLVGQGQPIVIPRLSDKIDYEGELAVIIGKRGQDNTENNAPSSLPGYPAANALRPPHLPVRTPQR